MTMSPAHGLRGLMRPRLGHYYAALAGLAAEADAGLIDVHAAWLAAPAAVRRFPDGLHPPDAAVRGVLLPPVGDAIARAMGQEGCAG